MTQLAHKFAKALFVMLAAMHVTASAAANDGEYPLLSRYEVEWQDLAGTTYSAIGSQQLDQITLDKLEACMKATGNNRFCQCLMSQLPVGLTFDGYVQSVTKSRQQLGYSEFSGNEKKMVDMAITVRNHCVTGSGPILVLGGDRQQTTLQSSEPNTTPVKAGLGKTPTSSTRAAVAKPPSSSGYLVQVASFKRQKDAEAMKYRLANFGLEAHTKTVDLPKRGRWHRVYLGPYTQRGKAEQIRSEVHDHLKLSTLLVRGKL